MKSLINFLILISIPVLSISQEFRFKPFLEITKNKTGQSCAKEKYKVKSRFEILSAFLKDNSIENHRISGNSILKQKLDSTFTSYINFPDLRNKYYYFYDQDGRAITSISKDWNDSAKMYLNSSKLDISYDAKGNQTLRIVSNGTGLSWVNSFKTEFNFNTENKLISVLYYDWNTTKKQWEQSRKDEISYDTKGNATLVLFFDWNATKNQWIASGKSELEYDTKGNLVLQIFYFWDNQWQFAGREEFTYNAFNQELSFVSLLWDDVNADWFNFAKSTNVYNSMQLLINYTQYQWDDAAGQWTPIEKTDYTYDMNGNMSNAIYSELDMSSQKWIPKFKEECSYNNQYAFDDLLLPDNPGLQSDIYFHHMLTKIGYFEYNVGNWHNSDNVVYSYSALNITNTTGYFPYEIKVLPNPAYNYFTIEMNDVSAPVDFTLSDINGKTIMTKKVIPGEPISTNNLSKGIYTFRINLTPGSLQTGKLVIQ